jgi:hypothetical protein
MNSYRDDWLAVRGSKPMFPAQMVRFYGGAEDHRSSQKDRLMAALGKALIALGQRVKSKNIAGVQT